MTPYEMKRETYAFRNRLTFQKSKKWLADILQDKSKISFDPHTTVYSYLMGIDPAKIEDEKFITSVILTSIVQARMKLMNFSLTKFKGGGGGITAVAVVSDSHIIVNTFPETGSLILDVYACSGSPINVLYEFVRRFKPSKYEFVVFPRVMEEETKILLDSINDKSLEKWLRLKELIPLTNVSEKSHLIFNLLGFIISSGKIEKNKISIELKDKVLRDILKEKLKGLKIEIITGYKNGKFTIEINNRNFVKFIKKLLNMVDSFLQTEKLNQSLLASFIAPILYKVVLESQKKNNKIIFKCNKYAHLLKKFNIKIKKMKDSCELNLTNENLMRIQAILSLNKIFPLGMFDPTIDVFPVYRMYSKKEAFYEIIDLLIEKKTMTEKELLSRINGKNKRKWLEKLNHQGIITQSGKKVKINLTI